MRIKPSTEIRKSFNHWLTGRGSKESSGSESPKGESTASRFPAPASDGGLSSMRPESAVQSVRRPAVTMVRSGVSMVRRSAAPTVQYSSSTKVRLSKPRRSQPEENGLRNMRPESDKVRTRAKRIHERISSPDALRFCRAAGKVRYSPKEVQSKEIQWSGRSEIAHWNEKRSPKRFPKPAAHEKPLTLTDSQKRSLRASTGGIKLTKSSGKPGPQPFGSEFRARRNMLNPKSPRFKRTPVPNSAFISFPEELSFPEEPKSTPSVSMQSQRAQRKMLSSKNLRFKATPVPDALFMSFPLKEEPTQPSVSIILNGSPKESVSVLGGYWTSLGATCPG